MTQIPSAFGLAPEQVRDLLTTAGRAPSLHNSQPWRFQLTPRAISLWADPRRALLVADPDGRELRMACGAALYNLRLALSRLGVRPIVTLFPDHAAPDLLAVIRRGGSKPATPEQDRLLSAVSRRRTNRHPFTDVVVAPPQLSALRRAALEEGAWLHFVQDREQRSALREMVARAHKTQMADPAFRAEMATWTDAAPGSPDGVPPGAGGSRPEPHDPWVLRDFSGATSRMRVEGKDFEEEPLIAVLTSHLSGTAAEVQAGQAMQRVLLTATADGLATSFLSEVVEVPRTREELRRLIGGTRPPQTVFRIGYGWPVADTPRRDPAALLEPATP